MRPVLLRMDGFAAFREPTVVDFRGADFFVLVGPTGAGKSTVIDAMTFALYGSVPRWDDRRTVAQALAPTAARGTVSLVFDSGGERYVAARALRRAANGGVTVREARLERLADPTGDGDDAGGTVPLADGAVRTSEAVAALLGLPFEDFCTCVVLPQGDFADFLHAAPGERQEKLERILGLGIYDVVMRRANAEAADAEKRAGWLDERLTGYADATEAAEHAATARVERLAALARSVDDESVPALRAALEAVLRVAEDAARLGDERDRLAPVTAPTDLTALTSRRRVATEAASRAAASLAGAERADTAARDRLADAPAREPLERARREHAERDAVTARLPALEAEHERARTAYAGAVEAATAAREDVERSRAARDAAASTRTAATDTATRLGSEQKALRAVAVPGGLDRLDRRRAAASEARSLARRELADAEDAEARARAELAAAPAREPAERARAAHRELVAARTSAERAASRVTTASEGDAEARAALAEARAAHDGARAHLAAAERVDLAAALRPALTAGAHCPVCAQTVVTLPEPLPAADLERARGALAGTETAHDRARDAASTAAATLAGARADAASSEAEVARLAADLTGAPSPEEADAALADADRRARDADDAAVRAREARRARDGAEEEVETVRRASAQATTTLRAARDPLVPLGAPGAGAGDVTSRHGEHADSVSDSTSSTGGGGDDDPVAGWRALVAWARTEAERRERELPAARDAADAAEREHGAAARALVTAERAAAARREEETVAARAEQAATVAVENARRRRHELDADLAGAPSAEEADAALADLAEREDAARAADVALRAARGALRDAERAVAGADAGLDQAWNALRAARDPLVALGAPAATGDDVTAAWDVLVTWAREQAAAREQALRAARAGLADAEAHRDARARALAADLAAADVPLDGTGVAPTASDATASTPTSGDAAALVRAAPAAVATAAGTARAARDRVAERRAEAAELIAERDATHEQAQVAGMLGDLLRSNNFPRWLVASALDALVADASQTLAALSGGQFELTHARGEFLVVDHTDADARRPVKTLSGGETFQASLALALALSAQLSGLAARGAAHLESIFLDEGFGTLDDATLDVVASTLENLAARGDRTVGLVTHVAALADRVPVRYTVHRDQRTASIEREGA